MAAAEPVEGVPPAEHKLDVELGAKEVAAFRVYKEAEGDGWDATVTKHYRVMRANQCWAFVEKMEAKWNEGFGTREKMTIAEAFEVLKGYVDTSDPDCEFPNLEHCLQAAEGIRKSGRPEWMQFVGLIHDMGKMMFKWGSPEDGQRGTAEGPQFALGGDTWVVGCRIPDCTVYPQFNALNPDREHPVMGTENGVYEPGCGIMNLKFAYGHDEYAYQFCIHNRIPIPREGLAMLRLHSCYPWHTGGAYRQFMAPGDEELMAAVLDFNQFDLYTKGAERPDVAKLWPYYEGLIAKFAPGKLDF